MSATCPWCHEPNDITPGTPSHCVTCQHRADVPRRACDCDACRQPTPREITQDDIDATREWLAR